MPAPWTRDIRFTPPPRPLGQVTEIIVHGSVTTSVERTVRVLKSRKDKKTGKPLGLSTHVVIDPAGQAHLTADLETRAVHCHQHNGVSVGVDVVEPYYPHTRGVRGEAIWPRVIDAPWAHGGQYVLPTLASIAGLVEVLRYLTGPDSGLQVPLVFVGVRGNRFRLGLLDDHDQRRPGIWAHHQAGDHADGAWPCLVAYLALVQGMPVPEAYEQAAQLATGAGGWVTLPSPSIIAVPAACPCCGRAA